VRRWELASLGYSWGKPGLCFHVGTQAALRKHLCEMFIFIRFYPPTWLSQLCLRDLPPFRVQEKGMQDHKAFDLLHLILFLSLIPSVLKDPLHRFIRVGCDELEQTAGQQHANPLKECDSKSHFSDDSHLGLQETGHPIITTVWFTLVAAMVRLCRCWGL